MCILFIFYRHKHFSIMPVHKKYSFQNSECEFYTQKSTCKLQVLFFLMEAPPRFELGIMVLQTNALPLGYSAKKNWSGLRGSNSLPPPWQGGALPDELNPHIGASGRNRTNDTRIFSPLLYRLSYRGVAFGKPKNGDLDGTRTHDLRRDRAAF